MHGAPRQRMLEAHEQRDLLGAGNRVLAEELALVGPFADVQPAHDAEGLQVREGRVAELRDDDLLLRFLEGRASPELQSERLHYCSIVRGAPSGYPGGRWAAILVVSEKEWLQLARRPRVQRFALRLTVDLAGLGLACFATRAQLDEGESLELERRWVISGGVARREAARADDESTETHVRQRVNGLEERLWQRHAAHGQLLERAEPRQEDHNPG